MGRRRSSLAELEALVRVAAPGENNLGLYLAEFGAELALRLCLAPEALTSIARLSDEDLAQQLEVILRRRAEGRDAQHAAAVHQASIAAARRLAATAVWQKGAAALDPDVLLGDLLLDTSRQHIVFQAAGLFEASLPRRTLIEAARVLPKQYPDLGAWVDTAGLHFRWRRGRGGLNFHSQTVATRVAAFDLHVNLPPPALVVPRPILAAPQPTPEVRVHPAPMPPAPAPARPVSPSRAAPVQRRRSWFAEVLSGLGFWP